MSADLIPANDFSAAAAEIERLQSEVVAQQAMIAEMREALDEVEACMSIVEPRSDKREYLRILDVVRAALSSPLTQGGTE